jgi:hypothetical protein
MERLGKFAELEAEFISALVRGFDRESITWKFPNSYGASVACNQLTHFVPELAVLKYDDKGCSKLVYDTPITSDVIPHVEMNQVQAILEEIKKLEGDKGE